MFSLKGKNALVAGGMGLIGSAIVRALHKQSASALTIDLKAGADFNFDITNRDLYSQLFDNMERCDVFVNATYPVDIIPHMQSFFVPLRFMAEWMKPNGGSIINLSSIYGVQGSNPSLYEDTEMKVTAGYAYNKAGIIGLTRWIATNYGRYNVRANCVCPGGVWDYQPEVFVNRYCERVPLGRMAKPEDVAAEVVYLASDEASYITGQARMVDGGLCESV